MRLLPALTLLALTLTAATASRSLAMSGHLGISSRALLQTSALQALSRGAAAGAVVAAPTAAEAGRQLATSLVATFAKLQAEALARLLELGIGSGATLAQRISSIQALAAAPAAPAASAAAAATRAPSPAAAALGIQQVNAFAPAASALPASVLQQLLSASAALSGGDDYDSGLARLTDALRPGSLLAELLGDGDYSDEGADALPPPQALQPVFAGSTGVTAGAATAPGIALRPAPVQSFSAPVAPAPAPVARAPVAPAPVARAPVPVARAAPAASPTRIAALLGAAVPTTPPISVRTGAAPAPAPVVRAAQGPAPAVVYAPVAPVAAAPVLSAGSGGGITVATDVPMSVSNPVTVDTPIDQARRRCPNLPKSCFSVFLTF